MGDSLLRQIFWTFLAIQSATLPHFRFGHNNSDYIFYPTSSLSQHAPSLPSSTLLSPSLSSSLLSSYKRYDYMELYHFRWAGLSQELSELDIRSSRPVTSCALLRPTENISLFVILHIGLWDILHTHDISTFAKNLDNFLRVKVPTSATVIVRTLTPVVPALLKDSAKRTYMNNSVIRSYNEKIV